MNWFVLILTLLFTNFFNFNESKIPQKRVSQCRKRYRHQNQQGKFKRVYGVSLSSITGFEKPGIPPRIINFNLPRESVINMNIDLPSLWDTQQFKNINNTIARNANTINK